jgi:hypothetical protein
MWTPIRTRYGKRIDEPLVEGVFNSLIEEQLLPVIPDGNGGLAAQITGKGRAYREELSNAKWTAVLAYLGAATGTISLIWNLVTKAASP